jgi:hypothetical protein
LLIQELIRIAAANTGHTLAPPVASEALTLAPTLVVLEVLTLVPTLVASAATLALVMDQQEHRPMPDHTVQISQTRQIQGLILIATANTVHTLVPLAVSEVRQEVLVALTVPQVAHMEMIPVPPTQDHTAQT